MSYVDINITEFRQAFPEFSNTTKYPDTYVNRHLSVAQLYISNQNFFLRPNVRKLAIQYMAAHLIFLETTDNNGNFIGWSDAATGGAITSSHIGDVSVTLHPPVATEEWELWLESTPYGKMLLALLQLQRPAFIYKTGRPNPWGIK